MITYVWITLLLLCLDQITKYLALHLLKPIETFPLLPGILQLQYVENRGAAFGLFQNHQLLFAVFAVAVTCACVWYYRSLGKSPRTFPLRLVCCMLSAGALGNMLDRLRLGYVVDFIYVSLIDFPVFNVADILVCVGCFLLLFLLFFVHQPALIDG